MATVTFDYAEWVTQYPELAATTEPVATLCFNQACVYCDPTDSSVVTDESIRKIMIYLLVAHVATLKARVATGAKIAGLITSASQGSVSVSSTLPIAGGNAWYLQTPYGFDFWNMSKPYRSFVYASSEPRDMEPIGIYGLFGNGNN